MRTIATYQWLLGEMLEETVHSAQVQVLNGLLWFSLEEQRVLVAMSSSRYAGCLR